MTINEIKLAVTNAGDNLTADFRDKHGADPRLSDAIKVISDNVALLCQGAEGKIYIAKNKDLHTVLTLVLMDGYKGNRGIAGEICKRAETL